MPKTIERLTETKVRTLTAPGKHADGGNGLYLRISRKAGSNSVTKSWVFRYRFPPRAKGGGKQRDLGLGTPAKFDLEAARGIVRQYWMMIERGEDPMAHRRNVHEAAPVQSEKHTYAQAANKYIAAKRNGWHPRHAKAWERGLKNYCKPIAALPVDAITADDVAKCLQKDWLTKPETTDRVRQQIERVLDAAAADGKRSRENPARWKGSLESKLPDRPKGRKSRPRTALPYADAPAFVAKLRERDGYSPRALELQILTAVRPGEAAGARWDEIDLDAAMWTIPGQRMKMGHEHRVPLSTQAVAMLRALPRFHDVLVFRGYRDTDKPITTAAAMKTLKALRPGFEAHGFRSTFRTWCAEVERCDRDIAEAALAHTIEGVEGDYNRAQFLEARRKVMQDWADYLDGKA